MNSIIIVLLECAAAVGMGLIIAAIVLWLADGSSPYRVLIGIAVLILAMFGLFNAPL